MPIEAATRWFYPIDWPQLSHHVRSERARTGLLDLGRLGLAVYPGNCSR